MGRGAFVGLKAELKAGFEAFTLFVSLFSLLSFTELVKIELSSCDTEGLEPISTGSKSYFWKKMKELKN